MSHDVAIPEIQLSGGVCPKFYATRRGGFARPACPCLYPKRSGGCGAGTGGLHQRAREIRPYVLIFGMHPVRGKLD
jgi:hypothetical protein